MAIPGVKPKFEVRGKVRIGEKKQSARGREFPASVDHFISPDDGELARLFGDKPKSIRIVSPYQRATDFFATGLELWRGTLLACYSKGEGNPPIALRRRTIREDGVDRDFTAGEEVRGEPVGNDRLPITCRFRECPLFKANDGCRPIGRLQFFLDGGHQTAVLQLDTKSWNSIEQIEAGLAGAVARDPDLRGRVFELTVAYQQKGQKRFPVLDIKEVDVQVNNDADVAKADALLQLQAAVDTQVTVEQLKPLLAAALNHTNPGWRQNEAIVARIVQIGPVEAAKGLLERHLG